VRREWAAALGNAGAFVYAAGYRSGVRVLCTTPLHHSYALGCGLLATLWAGGRLILAPAPLTPAGWLAAMRAERADIVQSVPFLYRCLLEAASDSAGTSLRRCIAAGEALAPDLARRWRDRFGATLCNHYGTTETGMVSLDVAGTAESTGPPLPGVAVRAVDAEGGQPVGPVRSGLLQIRCPGRPPSYCGQPGLTRDRLRGGWFATDDIGRVDAACRVVVESRRGRIINVAGNKVDPREVELALLSLPGVREAAAVGRQRDAGTEEVWAFLVATPGTRADQVRRSLAASLSSTKLPRRLVMVDELPRTATGKVRLGVLLASAERPDEEERRE